MNHARFQRWQFGHYCLLGLCLALVSPLTLAANPSSLRTTVDSIRARSGPTLDSLVVATEQKTRGLPGGRVLYSSTETVVKKSVFRKAGGILLKRAVPGLGALYTAYELAGLVFDEDTGQVMMPGEKSAIELPPNYAQLNHAGKGYTYSCYYSGLHSAATAFSAASACADAYGAYIGDTMSLTSVFTRDSDLFFAFKGKLSRHNIYSVSPTISERPPNTPETSIPAGENVPVPDDYDWSTVDQNLSPEIAQQIYDASQPVPDWQQEIDALPNSQTLSTSGNIPPAVAKTALQTAANQQAQLAGEDKPYPDTATDPGQSASDELLDQVNQPPPDGDADFPPQEPQWQVDVIDTLPDYDVGLGAGACPAPAVIPLPLGWGSFELNWQPICDFAGWIRGAVIAVGFIAALYIVLGVRSNA